MDAEKLYSNAKLSNPSLVEDVWGVVKEVFAENGILHKEYFVGHRSGGEDFKRISVDDVGKYKRRSGLLVVEVSDKKVGNRSTLGLQTISISDTNNLNLTLRANDGTGVLDSLYRRLSDEGKLINAVATREEYRSEQINVSTRLRLDQWLVAGPSLCKPGTNVFWGISAEMWFGPEFWEFSATDKEIVKAQPWLVCEDRESHLYVRAWPEPFTSDSGEQGEIQRKLLKLLFDFPRP